MPCRKLPHLLNGKIANSFLKKPKNTGLSNDYLLLKTFFDVLSSFLSELLILFSVNCFFIFRSMGEENSSREVFEEYITNLQEKAKEKERKREEEKVWILTVTFNLSGSLWFVFYFLKDQDRSHIT